MRESQYKVASSRWPAAATDRAQTNKTTQESYEMHLKTRRKHWCVWSLSLPHWFKVMPWMLTLLNFQVAHTWGPSGLPQRQVRIPRAKSKWCRWKIKKRCQQVRLICTNGENWALWGGTWRNRWDREDLEWCPRGPKYASSAHFLLVKMVVPSISDYKPAALNPKLHFSPTREMLSLWFFIWTIS